MKKSFFIVFILFLFHTSFAQINGRRFEISASGNLGSVSTISESGDYTYESEARLYFNTYIRAGYFLSGGFELEPEFYTFLTERGKPSFVMSANFVYNHQIGVTKFFPFLLIGYGLGNSYPFLTMTNSYIRMSDKLDVSCLNVGAGLKYFINKNIAFRTEFRYQRFHDKLESNIYTTSEFTEKINSLLIGFSILF